MPTWSPNWTDVPFDCAAAALAADECEAAADGLVATTSVLSDPIVAARRDWTGGTRRMFDQSLSYVGDERQATVGDLRRLADALRRACSDARAAQAEREAERLRWHGERLREEEEGE